MEGHDAMPRDPDLWDVYLHALWRGVQRLGAALLIALTLPMYLLGYGVGGLAVGTGRGCEAWWTDVKRYWKELKL